MKIIHGHNGRNYKFGNNNERKMYKPLNIYKYRKKSSSTTTCHTHAELARALESKIRKKRHKHHIMQVHIDSINQYWIGQMTISCVVRCPLNNTPATFLPFASAIYCSTKPQPIFRLIVFCFSGSSARPLFSLNSYASRSSTVDYAYKDVFMGTTRLTCCYDSI